MPQTPSFGATQGTVTLVLRIEGAAAVTTSVLAYTHLGGGWGLFAVLFLLPDLSMLGYLRNLRWGAALYNAGHSYLAPALVALVGWFVAERSALSIPLIWTAHIGLDRMLGYGLKYPTGFGATHLGWRGQRPT